jgi:Predicted membrane protein
MYSVVGSDGQVYGPVNQETLRTWCEEGRIVARTNLIDPISGRVLRAEDLDDLRPLLLAEPPIAEAPPIAPPPLPPLAPESVGTGTVGPYTPPSGGQVQAPTTGYEATPYPGQMPYPGAPTGPTFVSATQVNVHTPPGPQSYGVGGMPQQGAIAHPHQGPYQQPPHAGATVQVNNVVAYHPGQQQQYPPPPQQQSWGPHQAYGAYGPHSGVSSRSKVTSILLAFFLGTLGIHRFYLGHNGVGIAMLLITVLSLGFLAPITGIWAIIDIILIAVGNLRDQDGKPLS